MSNHILRIRTIYLFDITSGKGMERELLGCVWIKENGGIGRGIWMEKESLVWIAKWE